MKPFASSAVFQNQLHSIQGCVCVCTHLGASFGDVSGFSLTIVEVYHIYIMIGKAIVSALKS